MGKKVDLKKAKEKSTGFWSDFKEFAVKGNAMDLAIGVIIGGAFTSIVTSLVNDILMPLVGACTGGFDFSEKFLSLDGTKYASLAEAQEKGAAILAYGNFITAIINFLIVALVIFIVFKKLLVPRKKEVPVVAEITEKECPYCKTKIHVKATRCPHCTSELKE